MRSLNALSTSVLLLATSCARAPASAPVTLDADGWIRIDGGEPASEPACNRSAAEIILLRRQIDDRKQKVAILDCNEARQLAEERSKRAADAEKQATLFGRWGIASSVIAAVASVLVGFLVGVEVGVRK